MKKIFFFALLLILITGKNKAKASASINTPYKLALVSDSLYTTSHQTKKSVATHKSKFKNFTQAVTRIFTLAVLSSHVNSDANHTAPASLIINKTNN